MGMWLMPAIFTVIVIMIVSYWLTVRVGHNVEESGRELDTPVPKVIVEHPFLLNPIMLLYVIFGLFTGVIIFYYWARGYTG